jgi:transposase
VEGMRKRYPPSFKAKVALEAIKEQKTSAEMASLYQVHPGQLRIWKAVVLKGMLDLFSDRRKGKGQDNETLIAELYRGWLYLVAIMDWFSRYVLSWETSITMETGFCLTALEKAFVASTPGIPRRNGSNRQEASDHTESNGGGFILIESKKAIL